MRGLLLLLPLLLILVAACASPGLAPSGPPTFGDWEGMPTSWEKLDRIDRWLTARGPSASSEELLEARLELAEGRVELAVLDGSTIDARTRAIRLELAANGFSSVLSDSLASNHQRGRAEDGLAAVERMGHARAPEPAPRADKAALLSGIVSRRAWGAAPTRANVDPASGHWDRITIHHTAMAASHLMRGSLSSSAAELRMIQSQHQSSRGWADIGYHFLIDPAGRVFEGRSLRWQGAHAGRDERTGRNFNPGNIGICLLGNFQTERPTPAALNALEGLIETLQGRYSIARRELYGHEHFRTTECPGRNLAAWLARYKAAVALSEGGSSAALATASSSASTSRWGAQPSSTSRAGSPTSSFASWGRARAGSDRVR